MIKNFLKYSLTIFLSGLSVYLLTDKMLLPYILYVDEVAVPNIVGHDISTAAILLEDSNLKYKIQYITSEKNDIPGRIIDANPIGDFYFDSNKNGIYDKEELFVDQNNNGKYDQKTVKVGTTVYLKVLGEKENYIVPDLTLKSKNIGVSILKSLGVKVDTIFYDYWNTICTNPNNVDLNDSFNDLMDNCLKYKDNIIWNQFPEPNEKIFKDEGITLYVSKGSFAPEFYDVPNLIDLDLYKAIELVNKSGLLLGRINHSSDSINYRSKVLDQSLIGPSRITEKINLTIE